MDGWMDGWMDGGTDGRTGRQNVALLLGVMLQIEVAKTKLK
jgi:hypothetical protein